MTDSQRPATKFSDPNPTFILTTSRVYVPGAQPAEADVTETGSGGCCSPAARQATATATGCCGTGLEESTSRCC
ncbi:MAG: hypothetical protein AAF560_14415 [Acidobacteriota bacterium]